MVVVLVAGLVSVPGAAAWSGPRTQELPGSLATASLDPDTGGRNYVEQQTFAKFHSARRRFQQ